MDPGVFFAKMAKVKTSKLGGGVEGGAAAQTAGN